MEKVKITILCENRTSITRGVTAEHGFAALIEKGNETILLDTGQGLTLAANALALGIDLGEVTKVVLSHGHYDHTSGLMDISHPNKNIELIAHPQVFSEKYSLQSGPDGDFYSYIGIQEKKQFIESHFRTSFTFISAFREIADGVYFSGEVPRVTDFEKCDKRLKIKDGDSFIDDPLIDDTSLLIETASGPVIISGCAHSGIINVMKHFEKQTGYREFHAVIGGTHLGFLNSEEQVNQSMDYFEAYGLDLIAVSHCTGNEAGAMCYNRFKEKFSFANAGWSHTF